MSVTATSTTGKPPSGPCCRKSDTPISTEGMNERGTTPPVIFSSNWKPEPRGSGLMSSTTSPNCPWPPDCFLCRPRISMPFLMVSL